MKLPESALRLAGFALAHAAWNVSDLPNDELLAPLAVVEQDAQRRVVRFEAATQEAAISKGTAAMAELGASVDGWAFARDAIFREADALTDALSIDFWTKGMEAPATLLQPYEPFATRGTFKVLGDPLIVIHGELLDSRETLASLAAVIRGIEDHPKVKALWANWH